jgi:Kelch motif/Galactose oxidase, central domain
MRATSSDRQCPWGSVTGRRSAWRVTAAFVVALILAAPSSAGAAASWSPTGAMTTPRAYHTATLLMDGRVLVVGGRIDVSATAMRGAELYDPVTGRWSATGDMAVPRFVHTATLLRDGRVLVAGGFGGGIDGEAAQASAELYDPRTGSWSPTGGMSAARGAHTATLLPDGKVLVAGGSPNWGGSQLATAEVYDPATGRWSPTASMHIARSAHSATALPRGEVLVAGGFGPGVERPLQDSAEVYDAASGRWSQTGSMNALRGYQTATLLSDGTVLVAGGYVDGLSADLYDPSTGRWSPTGSLTIYHFSGATATLLPDGTVLLVGGSDPAHAVAAAELYDPALGVWRDAPPMSAARYFHTATLLRDGRVLVAGGYESVVPTLASAELYGNADDTAPVTTATVSPAPNSAGWNRTAVNLTLHAVDESGGSGIAALTYRATGAEPIATTTVQGGRVTIVLRAQGTTTLTYFARDAAGNVEAAKRRVVRIDETAPRLRVADLLVPATSATGALVSTYPVSATDNLDPRPAIRCSPAAPRLFAPDSTSTVTCSANDRAGNTTRRSFAVHVAGAVEQLVALRAELANMAIPPRAERRLDRDLARALRALRRQRPRRACTHLRAFVRHVDRYGDDGTLTAAQAQRLRAVGSRIMRVVPCGTGDDS